MCKNDLIALGQRKRHFFKEFERLSMPKSLIFGKKVGGRKEEGGGRRLKKCDKGNE